MKFITLNHWIKLLLIAVLIPCPLIPAPEAEAKAAAKAKGPSCQPLKACQDEVKKFQATDAATGAMGAKSSGTVRADAGTMMQGAAANAGAATTASGACQKQCTPDPKGKGCTQKDCDEMKKMAGTMGTAALSAGAAGAGAGDTQQQASGEGAPQSAGAGAGGGGGMGEMMGPLLGAAAGAGLAYMMMKKNDDDEEEDEFLGQPIPVVNTQQPNPYASVQPNGTIACDKYDSFMYQACNTFLEAKCRPLPDDPLCQQFSARYCGGGGSAPAVAPIANAPAYTPGMPGMPATQPLIGPTGEGGGTPYCQFVMGWNFCKVPGRQDCPSCLQIAKNQSPTCAQNPALCLAQNSGSAIEAAKQTCPTDPAFSNPAFIAGGAAVGNTGAPAVVLPQNSSSQGQGSTQAGSGGGISTSYSTASYNNKKTKMGTASASNPSEQAAREGYSQAQLAGTNGSASAAGAGRVAPRYAAASVNGRELASAGVNGYRSASVGPASDVVGQYGPSLFSTQSQVIRKRCQAGRLKNCP